MLQCCLILISDVQSLVTKNWKPRRHRNLRFPRVQRRPVTLERTQSMWCLKACAWWVGCLMFDPHIYNSVMLSIFIDQPMLWIWRWPSQLLVDLCPASSQVDFDPDFAPSVPRNWERKSLKMTTKQLKATNRKQHRKKTSKHKASKSLKQKHDGSKFDHVRSVRKHNDGTRIIVSSSDGISTCIEGCQFYFWLKMNSD